MLETKIKIFETKIEDGIFSRNKKFYPSNVTESDILKRFLSVKEYVGKKYGFNGKRVFQPLQKNGTNNVEYPDGKYIILDESYMTKEDYWFERIPTDILILEEKYKGIVIGHQMADCPILIAEDRQKGVTALAHCGASYIDRLLPKQTIEALINAYNSNLEDIYVYVGSCAKKENYVYDRFPIWAKNNAIWDKNISLEDDGYHINLNGAIKQQLQDIGIIHIEESPIDTILDNSYYSHVAAIKGDIKKIGQNFVGFYYI